MVLIQSWGFMGLKGHVNQLVKLMAFISVETGGKFH